MIIQVLSPLQATLYSSLYSQTEILQTHIQHRFHLYDFFKGVLEKLNFLQQSISLFQVTDFLL